MKNADLVFGFWDNTFWIWCEKFLLLWRDYMPSAVKMLTNSANISDLTKSNFLELILSHINGTVL